MPPRDWRQRAGDIIALADAVARSTEGMTLDEFAADMQRLLDLYPDVTGV